MAGISSKAAGSLENKKKYNGIEFDEDLDIDTYEAFYRNLDPQTGRWWQIDPKVEGQESLSPYNSMANDPIRYSDPLGDVPDDGGPGDPPGIVSRLGTAITETANQVIALGLGVANAWGSDQFLGAGSKSAGEVGFSGDRGAFYNAGQTVGHAAAIVTGLAETILGGGGEIASLGIATPVAIPLALHGVSVIATAGSKLLTQGSSEGGGNSGRGKNHSKPDPLAQGNHSTIKRDPNTQKTTGYTTYEKNKKNPSGFQEKKRVDVTGAPHKSSKNGQPIPTPHVHLPKKRDPRPARQNELPNQ